jgi:TatD DNase family protein
LNLVDAHVHLPAYPDPTDVIAIARGAGTSLLSCTVNEREALVNLRLRELYPETVLSFLGVHPSDVSDVLPSTVLGDLFSSADGVGEIGLDAKYSDASPGSDQMKAFVDQLVVAERLGKPVEVHSRGSEKSCLEVLSSFRLKSVLMHWFEGEEHINEVASRGYFVSVGPAVLYSKKLRRIAQLVPSGRVLTESDGPVAYKPLGDRGGPAMIPSVLFTLGGLRGISFEAEAQEVYDGFHSFMLRS